MVFIYIQVISPSDLLAASDLQMYPAFAAAVVTAYNVQGFTPADDPLVFSRSTLVGIFAGNITFWNASEIQADNPSVRRSKYKSVALHDLQFDFEIRVGKTQ